MINKLRNIKGNCQTKTQQLLKKSESEEIWGYNTHRTSESVQGQEWLEKEEEEEEKEEEEKRCV